jgi:hypothetical protein
MTIWTQDDQIVRYVVFSIPINVVDFHKGPVIYRMSLIPPTQFTRTICNF